MTFLVSSYSGFLQSKPIDFSEFSEFKLECPVTEQLGQGTNLDGGKKQKQNLVADINELNSITTSNFNHIGFL